MMSNVGVASGVGQGVLTKTFEIRQTTKIDVGRYPDSRSQILQKLRHLYFSARILSKGKIKLESFKNLGHHLVACIICPLEKQAVQ